MLRRAAARRPTFLLAQKHGPKMRPWRVGRAVKPHDCASRLRGSLTARPCADSELARIHSGHPAGFSESTSPPRNGMKIKSTQRALRRAAAARRTLLLVTHAPVPVGKCWTDQPLAGHAMDRVASAAAQDVPSAEPGQCLRTRTASPCERQAIGTHLWGTLSVRQKSNRVGGSRTIRLTSLATASQRQSRRPNKAKVTSQLKNLHKGWALLPGSFPSGRRKPCAPPGEKKKR